jgi:hypothetical protein
LLSVKVEGLVKLTRVGTPVVHQDRQAIPDILFRSGSPYEHIQNKNDKRRNEDKLHAQIDVEWGFVLLDRAGVVD